MRVDPRISQADRDNLTSRQLFFIECWGSLSHKESSDTDRVSFNNILHAINELLDLMRPDSKVKKGPERRVRVAQELLDILKTDPALQGGICGELPVQIRDMLDHKNAWSDKERSPVEKQQGLMESLLRELRLRIEAEYPGHCIRLLETELQKITPAVDADYAIIARISNNLMSVLLTLGMPLAECYMNYVRTLMKSEMPFEHRFGSWADKVNVKKKAYKIVLRLENDKLYDMLMTTGQGIEFNECNYTPVIVHDKKGAYVAIKVEAVSVLAAKVSADYKLKDSLDVVSYMTGNGQIEIRNSFSVDSEDGIEVNIRGFSNEIMTNSDRLTLSEFAHFMNAISSLCTRASPESVKKISSAFHFLRNGLVNTKTQENKFTSLWSALEALTLNVSSKQMDHDEHVVFTAAPCMGLDYITKQLISIRGIASTLSVSVQLGGNQIVEPGALTLVELYEQLKDAQFTSQFDAELSKYPYAAFMLRKFASLCLDPRLLGTKVNQHRGKVELHIYRLYILRNAIIHNADSSPYFDFLNANLEHYLRGTINAMYYTASMLEVVKSPEEAFQRYLHLFSLLVRQLEPTFDVPPAEHKSIEASIAQGRITPSDTILREWLKLHN